MFFDTHAHLNFRDYKGDADEIIRKCLGEKMQIVNVGAEYRTSFRAVEYAEKYGTGVWAAAGLHPTHLVERIYHSKEGRAVFETHGENFDRQKYLKLAQHPKVVAIGEIGLDYHHFEAGDNVEELKARQKETFGEFIDLANAVEKPVMIHCWDAFPDLLDTLREKEIKKKGIIHSFSGNHKTARELRAAGFKLGFNGIITYSDSYDKVIREMPLSDMVLETDCPYLTPRPLDRLSRNEPMNVKYVAQKIAEIKNSSIDEVAMVTTENARKILGV